MLNYSKEEIKEITDGIKDAMENNKEFYWQEDMVYLLDVIDKYIFNVEKTNPHTKKEIYGIIIKNRYEDKYMKKGMGWGKPRKNLG